MHAVLQELWQGGGMKWIAYWMLLLLPVVVPGRFGHGALHVPALVVGLEGGAHFRVEEAVD